MYYFDGTVPAGPTQPGGSHKEGDTYFNTTEQTFYIFIGGRWIEACGGGKFVKKDGDTMLGLLTVDTGVDDAIRITRDGFRGGTVDIRSNMYEISNRNDYEFKLNSNSNYNSIQWVAGSDPAETARVYFCNATPPNGTTLRAHLWNIGHLNTYKLTASGLALRGNSNQLVKGDGLLTNAIGTNTYDNPLLAISPHLWTVGQIHSFPDGSSGRRWVGNLASPAAANAAVEITLFSLSTATTIISSGGSWRDGSTPGQKYVLGHNYSSNVFSGIRHHMGSATVTFFSQSEFARNAGAASAYDIWIRWR
jgi:hypothetical protein